MRLVELSKVVGSGKGPMAGNALTQMPALDMGRAEYTGQMR